MIASLHRDGIYVLPKQMTNRQVVEYEQHIKCAPTYNAHVKVYGDGMPRYLLDTLEISEVACSEMQTVVTAPHFFEVALKFLPVASEYFGEPALLYSMNAFWVRPGKLDVQGIQNWHRDNDDRKFLALFMYGSEVMFEQDGPHEFKKGTHLPDEKGEFSDKAEGEIFTIYGESGTMFLAATRGLHRGVKPTRGNRLLSWARFCVSHPEAAASEGRGHAYTFDKLSPVPLALMAGRVPSGLEGSVRLVVS